ncbi:hypothetical protein [Microlunatus parietis]|uniref:Nucleotidyltransferase domain-containing protein n=1 Tax=Microlunatus parietis TaxID=682979 RepID=A0A7Y9L6F1_9ACTN|nr:hypothetical protein [Microlunatus parietis]NYE68699.1 hypothetical protein [Microlunatus parietis]
MGNASPSDRKREQLLDFTMSQLAQHEAVRGVVATGSVALGLAREGDATVPGSDIDAVVFMEPLDPYLLPAEFVWRRADNTYHSIISDDPELDRVGVQFDLDRFDLAIWRSADFIWPEPRRAELADGWIAYDPTGEIAALIKARTMMPDVDRLAILDQTIGQAIAVIPNGDAELHWQKLGGPEAFDRLQAGYQELTRAIFAYHGKWRPWRSRELRGLQNLEWLPQGFTNNVPSLIATDGHDFAAYSRRAAALRSALEELVSRLQTDRIYGDDPDGESFVRLHDEPGRAWNMDEWNAEHARRFTKITGDHP